MRLLGPTPLVKAYLRRTFMHDCELNTAGVVACYVIGFCALPGRIPAFQVVTEEGAQWARVPVHMLSTAPCSPFLPHTECAWWDCYGYEFAIATLPLLNCCTAISRTGVRRRGRYLFTVDWCGDQLEEVPDQHKNHHIIELETGQLIAYPNNKLLWHDASWIRGMPERPGWKVNTHEWSVEGFDTLPDQDARDYGGNAT